MLTGPGDAGSVHTEQDIISLSKGQVYFKKGEQNAGLKSTEAREERKGT